MLAQHCVTVALGGGFRPDDLLAEVRETAAYEHLSDENWTWVLDFIRRGGPSLTAYPGFRRVVPDAKGVWRVPDRQVALQHKLNIGAIVSDASVMVQYGPAPRGAKLGDGRGELCRAHEGGRQVLVRRPPAGIRALARPDGLCARRERRRRDAALAGRPHAAVDDARRRHAGRLRAGRSAMSTTEPELAAARPLIEVQRRWSALPTPETLLAETLKSREGWHLFLYPFAGRDIHLGLTSLIAWRAARERQGVFSLSVNDYGFEILSANARDWAAMLPVPASRRPKPSTR